MAANTDPTAIGLVMRLGQAARRRRLEVTIVVVAGLLRWGLSSAIGPDGLVVTDLASVGLLAMLIAEPHARRTVLAALARRARRARWDHALAGLWPPPATPCITGHEIGPFGDRVTVRVGRGGTVTDLVANAEALAAWLETTEVRVTPNEQSAAWATLTAYHQDPLAGPATSWPGLATRQGSLWWPVPVGVDEDGSPVTVSLAGHNLLVGGEPGAGKSVAVSQLLAAASLDPSATLWLLDGKLVELAAWIPVAAASAGIPIADAIAVLERIQQEMDSRYRRLLSEQRRKIPEGTGLHVVVIDELAHYLTWADKKPRDRFTDLLRDLVSRGRAAGIVVIAATQKPSSDVVPTSLRDLFGYRWALRCTTPAASDTILGSGWASQGVTASTIPPADRGVGWLLHETGLPIRLRAHHLDDHTIRNLVTRAFHLRQRRGTQP